MDCSFFATFIAILSIFPKTSPPPAAYSFCAVSVDTKRRYDLAHCDNHSFPKHSLSRVSASVHCTTHSLRFPDCIHVCRQKPQVSSRSTTESFASHRFPTAPMQLSLPQLATRLCMISLSPLLSPKSYNSYRIMLTQALRTPARPASCSDSAGSRNSPLAPLPAH